MSYKYSFPDGWAEGELQEFCIKVADGTHDSPKKSDDGKLLVTSKNIIGGILDLSKSYRISEGDFNEVNRRSKVDINDVLLSMIGTVGEACLIEQEPDFAIKNVGLLKNDDPLRAKWLYFYLTSPQAQAQIKERLRGTTQQYLPLGEIRKFPIIFPESRALMQSIVEILGASVFFKLVGTDS
jgi:type I restriction enzyme S subunit